MSEAKDKEQKNSGDVDERLAEFARRVRDGERTVDLFGLDDGFVDNVLHKAHQLYLDRCYDQAEVLVRGASALDETRAYPHLLLGDILLHRGRMAEAVEHLERAHQINPEEAATVSKLGEAYLRQGRRKDAQQMLQRAVDEFEEGSPHRRRASSLLEVASGERSAKPASA